MNKHKYLVLIAGPTASGKSALAVQLAKQYNTAIISADSRQFFREMNIGTAKPTEAEMEGIPHYLINSHSITTPYSVGDYERDVLQLLDSLYTKHDVVIMAGGSGLYFRAVCQGVDVFPDVQPEVLDTLQQLYQNEGISTLQQLLKEKDPEYFTLVDIANPQRMIRALAVVLSSGKPFSSFRKAQKAERPFTCLKIALFLEKAELYQRINKRVLDMVQKGLLAEAEALYPLRHLNALQTVGYQELFSYMEGALTFEEAINLIQRNSRRYAKRQLTWLRKEPEVNWFNAHDTEGITAFLQSKMG